MSGRRLRGVALVVALAVVAGLGARLVQVHAQTWQWALVPSATAPRLEFAERGYLRGAVQQSSPAGWTPQGRTLGGGTILAPPGGQVPTGVYVRTGTQLVEYALSGGP